MRLRWWTAHREASRRWVRGRPMSAGCRWTSRPWWPSLGDRPALWLVRSALRPEATWPPVSVDPTRVCERRYGGASVRLELFQTDRPVAWANATTNVKLSNMSALRWLSNDADERWAVTIGHSDGGKTRSIRATLARCWSRLCMRRYSLVFAGIDYYSRLSIAATAEKSTNDKRQIRTW